MRFISNMAFVAGILLFLLISGCTQQQTPQENITSCSNVSEPVCGTDGRTYRNICYAQVANTTVATIGECVVPPQPEIFCSDSDNGKEKSISGTIKVRSNSAVLGEWVDSCLNNISVTEYFCSGNNMGNETIPCGTNMECVEGECITKCVDSDAVVGLDPTTVRGTTSSGTTSKTDACVDDKTIREYFCQKGNVTEIITPCPPLYHCSNGQCNAENCTDSDGGRNVGAFGIAVYGMGFGADSCVNSSSVKEYFCENGVMENLIDPCPSGYACNDGACLNPNTDCVDSDGNAVPDITVRGTIRKGNETKTDSCDNAGDVREYYCSNNSIAYSIFSCSPGSCSDGRCINSDAKCIDSDIGEGQDLTERGNISKGPVTKQDICLDANVVVEYGCENGTIIANNVVCPPFYSCNDGQCVAGNCSDSDGGIYPRTYGIAQKGLQAGRDYCQNSSALMEYFCSNDQIDYTIVSCPRNSCNSGRCMSMTP